MNEYIWEDKTSTKLFVFLLEMIVAIGGPKTNQHAKDRNKSFNKTKIVLIRRFNEFNFVPIKFIA